MSTEVVGDDRLLEHLRAVAATVVANIRAGKPGGFVTAWSEGESALTLPAWQAWRDAQATACKLICSDLLTETTPALRAAWGEAVTDVTDALTKPGHDVSIERAMSDPVEMGRAMDAATRLGSLVDATDALLDAGSTGLRDWASRAVALHRDHRIAWASEVLVVLQETSQLLLDPAAEIASDPFNARYADEPVSV